MPDWPLQTPVAFFIYNRPDTTARAFETIRQAKPPRLFIVADGPRTANANDQERCRLARAVTEGVDWPCQVLRDYADNNLGCKQRVSSGLDWVFRVAEEAIIVEDDCLPHTTFFQFCEKLLERYRYDDRMMHIGGSNFQPSQFAAPLSYYFSRYPHVWGWASWRRAWQHYDVNLSDWADAPDASRYLRQFEQRTEQKFWRTIWDAVRAGRIDTWDYQWAFACLQRDGLAIVPARNLVTNIGFGTNSTNTHFASPGANIPQVPMVFPLSHPLTVARDTLADDRTRRLFFTSPSVTQRVLARLRRRMKGVMA